MGCVCGLFRYWVISNERAEGQYGDFGTLRKTESGRRNSSWFSPLSHLGYCRSELAVFKSTAPPRIRGLRATKRCKKVINAKTTLNKEPETRNLEHEPPGEPSNLGQQSVLRELWIRSQPGAWNTLNVEHMSRQAPC